MRKVTLLALVLCLFVVPNAHVVAEPASIAIAGIRTTQDQKYIQLYNPSDQDYATEGLSVLYYPGSRTDLVNPTTVAEFSGSISAKSYVLIAQASWDVPAGVQVDATFSASILAVGGGTVQVVDGDEELDRFCWESSTLCGDDKYPALPTGQAYQHCLDEQGVPIVCQTDGTYHDYYLQTAEPAILGGGFVPAPINECGGLILSEIGANLDNGQQFVEIHNPTSQPIDLTGCQLQTNRSKTASYIFGPEILTSGSYRAVFVKDTSLALTKTTSGTVYLLSSDQSIEVDAQSYQNLKAETSWAWFGEGDWRQTYKPTPGQSNTWQEFLPCPAGQERNPDTGRCRNAIAAATELKPCAPGQERNPDTNRCRSTAGSTRELTPCKPGQERNPETNRCRSTSSSSSNLKPCGPGQERNPETNRCRKVAGATTGGADDVQDIEAAQTNPLTWWIAGTAATGAATYALWEYRRDIRGWLSKFLPTNASK